ncbi:MULTISPECIES: myo-inositol-1-phosphate synthase [unclassified Streptomyces]|uniref:myo-inositol-1-phosphate synthase n=1 Tax=unclassified Streptomyces TaxID=2593676 RepID=UPI000CD5604E|nr:MULTISPECIES: myo-inositol-1-phosphate synthase [unclassified Streptomyces]
MRAIRVALAGAGNCAWSFSQFVAQAHAAPAAPLPGLMCQTIGGYRLADVRVAVAFDVDADKVGRPLATAFEAPTISATRFAELDADKDAPVLPAPLLDGLVGPMGTVVTPAEETHDATSDSVAKAIVEHAVDVLVISLPTGATQAVRMFAEAALAAGAAVVNCTPERVARDEELSARFADAGVPLLGDDLRSHLGATTLHTALIELLLSRGLELESTYQLNVGGNTDFLNLADATRSASKFTSKANALRAAGMTDVSGVAGPTGYIGHLADTKLCFANLRARSVLGSEVQIDVKLTVEDSPNAAGVIANAVRAAMTAVDRGLSGAVDGPAPMLFKSPPRGLPESQARSAFLDFAA